MSRLILLFSILFPLPALAQPAGYIHTSNAQVVDGAGKPVKLNGVNLGGWLLWEGWIFGGGFTSETKMMKQLTELYGKEEAEKFRQTVREQMITEEDIKAISGLCMNVVRVPINHELLEGDAQPYKYKEEGFQLLDRLLGWCEKYNVYAVLDLHGAPGGQNNYFISDADKDSKSRMWNSAESQKRTYALWKAIASRYANRTIIAGYDLLNEPIPKKPAQLVSFYRSAIDTIRQVDKNHMIILEGAQFARDFSMFDKVMDDNQLFSFHVYTWFTKDVKGKIAKHDAFAKKVGVPVWCGEWGENTYEELMKTLLLFNDASYSFCGSAFWTWKKVEKKNSNYRALNAITPGEEWMQVVKYLSGKGKKSDAALAQKAKEKFLSALKYSSNTPNPTMQKILSGCKTQ
jgi:aryl-phospho-beta-D-glucosidase BglC (GH1 family)